MAARRYRSYTFVPLYPSPLDVEAAGTLRAAANPAARCPAYAVTMPHTGLTFFGATGSQAQEDRELRELLQQGAWRRLVPRGAPAGSLGFDRGPLTSHAAIYDAIGAAYGVPAFALLGSSLQRINDKGQSPGEVLTALARTSAENEVAEMLVRSEQARIRQAIPVGLMIVPLLVLVGYPLLTAMSTALGT